jgi:hypothetical protein
LASDFSRFHRIHDITKLPGPVFFRMAHRIGAYGGVMALRGHERQQETPAPQPPPRPAVPGPAVAAPAPVVPRDAHGRETVPGTREAIAALPPELGKIFSFA